MDVMDRDLWMTSGNKALGAVLATQADMDDVLRAAANAPGGKRRGLLRRTRKADVVETVTSEGAEAVVATAGKAGHRI